MRSSGGAFEPNVRRAAVRSEEEGNCGQAYLRGMGSGGRGTANQRSQRGAVPDPVILELRYRPESDSHRIAGDAESDDTRADLARQLNASIYKAAQSVTHHEDEGAELTFFCACGCMAEVKRSLRDYVTRGAIIAGHARPENGDARSLHE